MLAQMCFAFGFLTAIIMVLWVMLFHSCVANLNTQDRHTVTIAFDGAYLILLPHLSSLVVGAFAYFLVDILHPKSFGGGLVTILIWQMLNVLAFIFTLVVAQRAVCPSLASPWCFGVMLVVDLFCNLVWIGSSSSSVHFWILLVFEVVYQIARSSGFLFETSATIIHAVKKHRLGYLILKGS